MELDWRLRARCVGAWDYMFVPGGRQNRAKLICTDCAVRAECLAEALDNGVEWGVWGGMTERERRALLNKHPNRNWRRALLGLE